MLWKQHGNFKSRLLAVLFLFFNCVCTAAPVVKLTCENYEEVVSIRLVQVPSPLEGEEGSHNSALGYINHVHHFSVRRHSDNHVCNATITNAVVSLSAVESSLLYIPDASHLPVPGNDAFLFRYTLF
jgi:hypothetical protein